MDSKNHKSNCLVGIHTIVTWSSKDIFISQVYTTSRYYTQPKLYKGWSQKMWLLTNWPHHLQAVTKGLSFETSDFDVKEGTASVATSSGVCTGWEGFGVYVKLRSLFSDRAMSSFSSKPLVGSKLHLSGVCLANASLNFLICHQNRTISVIFKFNVVTNKESMIR